MATARSKKVTIKDVAQMAGVAPSTVSFVLNNAKGQTISEETREHILRCVEQLGYRPNHSASSIRSGSARTIGVVTTYRVHSMYFLDLINGVMEEAEKAKYGVMICPRLQDGENHYPFVDYFMERRIDGIVFISSAHSEEKSKECDYISMFRKYSIPFCVIYGYTTFPGVGYANTNFFEDGRRACQVLLEKQCKKIVYIGALDKDNKSLYMPQTEKDRLNGYASMLAEHGRPMCAIHFPRDFQAGNYEDLQRTVLELDADGFITCWATYGLQLLTLLREVGLRVPEDVRVIALDSIPYLEYAATPLCSVRMPFKEMARAGTEMLLEQLSNPDFQPTLRRFAGIWEPRASV